MDVAIETRVLKYKISEAETDIECEKLMLEYLGKKGYYLSNVMPDLAPKYYPEQMNTPTNMTPGIIIRSHDVTEINASREISNFDYERLAKNSIDFDLMILESLGKEILNGIIKSGCFDLNSEFNMNQDSTKYHMALPMINKPLVRSNANDSVLIEDKKGWQRSKITSKGHTWI